jgi:hypothetical protein
MNRLINNHHNKQTLANVGPHDKQKLNKMESSTEKVR